jgi:phosphohistidine phosphatase SixA
MSDMQMPASAATTTKQTEQLLRAAVAACFIGHGAFGILRKTEWLTYFGLFGIDAQVAAQLMPLIGSVDIMVGLLALLWPARAVFLYAALWAAFTAVLRPFAGEGIAEALERAGNYGAPLALLALLGVGSSRMWLQRARASSAENLILVSRIARSATCLLLTGHGLLALAGKPLLLSHLAGVGLPSYAVQMLGAFELALALACLILPSRSLLLGVALWKVATESLFVWTGAPIWEFVERGGSYLVPVVAALLVPHDPAWAPLQSATLARSVRVLTAWLGILLLPALASAQQNGVPRATSETISQLRQGGLILACRHAITDRAREDKQPVDFDRPETQRVLSPEGERQATELGSAIKRLALQFGDVRSSPYQRTRRSAQLMFGQVTIDSVLFGMNQGKQRRLKELLSELPAAPANRLLMTHQGVLYPLFPAVKHGSIAEGDCIVVRPEGGSYTPFAHIKPEDWR